MATRFEDFLREMLDSDPELRDEYERLGPRFDAISAMIRARKRAGVSQSELARRMNVQPNVISRLESAEHSPRLDTLAAAARALGCELRVKFVRARQTDSVVRAAPTRSHPATGRRPTTRSRRRR